MNGYELTAVFCALITIVILATMNFYISVDPEVNLTKRKEMEEETKRMLHGDK